MNPSLSKRSILCFFIGLNLATSCMALTKTNSMDWHDYIDGTVGWINYYLYQQVVNRYFMSPGKYSALDLGAGAGNEDIDLVSKGWAVESVDASPRSGEVILERARGLKGQAQFQQADFSTVKLTGYYDFVFSFFALPFGHKNELDPLLKKLAQHMKPGAIFAANFFGYQHAYIKRGIAYGIDKAELYAYLKRYRFRVEYFLNLQYDQSDFEGSPGHRDLLDVIAVKE